MALRLILRRSRDHVGFNPAFCWWIALWLPGTLLAATPLGVDPAGHWEGVLQHGAHTWRVELDLTRKAGPTPGSVSYPDGGWFAVSLGGLRVDGTAIELTHSLDRDAVLWRGTLLGDEFSGTWKGLGVIATFRLTRAEATPRVFKIAPVRFRSENVVLGGTLILPATRGPHPAVVWIHGSGSVGRRQRSYRMWGYLLARHGVACLLYDKRGVGTSTGSFQTASLGDLASDALAGVQVLRSHPDIDPSRIGIGGFSQGGMIAPLALTRDKSLAFIMAVSAPGVSPVEQSDFAITNRLAAQGFGREVVAKATALRRRVNEFVRTGRGRDALVIDLGKYLRAPWFMAARLPTSRLDAYRAAIPGWAFLDPVRLWRRVNVPALAVWGGDDQLVPAVRSFDLIGTALAAAGNIDETLRILPGVDHDLMSSHDNTAEWDWPRMAPELEPMLAEWIRKHVTQPSPNDHPRNSATRWHDSTR